MPKSHDVIKSDGQIERAGLLACSKDLLRKYAHHVVNSVARLPNIEEPVYDESYQPGKCNVVQLSLYNWSHVYQKVEYFFTDKGFIAWGKLFGGFAIFAVPLVVAIAILWVLVVLVGQLCGLAQATTSLVGAVVLLGLSVVGLILISYLLYAIITTLRGKPVIVPKPTFDVRSPEKGAVPTIKVEEPIDVDVEDNRDPESGEQ